MRARAIQRGFTLIELMIVVAIIAILAAIAVPAYQNYLIRAQVSEGTVLATWAKTAVSDFVAQYGTFPSNNQSAGLTSAGSMSGKYVSEVKVADGKITAKFGNQANPAIQGKTLVLSPNTSAGSIVWTCNQAGNADAVSTKYLPSTCRG